MWAVDLKCTERHFFGRGSTPVAICGYHAKNGLDYVMHIGYPKCFKCKQLMGIQREPDPRFNSGRLGGPFRSSRDGLD